MTRYDWYSNGLMTWYRISCELLLIPAFPNHWLKFFNKEQLVQSVYFGHFVLSNCVKHLCQKGLNWKRMLCTIVSSLRCRRWKGTGRNPQTPATHTTYKGQKLIHFFFFVIYLFNESVWIRKARPDLACVRALHISLWYLYIMSPRSPTKKKLKRKIVGAVRSMGSWSCEKKSRKLLAFTIFT